MVDMVRESFQMWQQLEKEAETKIFRQTGMLLIDSESPPQESNEWDKVFANCDIPHEYLTSKELCARYRGIEFHGNYKVTLEKMAGVLAAGKALVCYQNLLLKHGGKILDGEKVLDIIPKRKVTVKTMQGTYVAKSLILTPGPWASQLLHPLGLKLPLTVERINTCYWHEKVQGTFLKFPVFADVTVRDPVNAERDTVVYGLPSDEYPGLMKVCLHQGTTIADADSRDRPENGNMEDIDILSRYIRHHFPGLDDLPHIVEPCLYTNTPDHVPIIDQHPVFPNIVFACGMSGAGFKFAPVYGKILTQLIFGEHVDYDLSAFRYNRFNEPGGGTMSKL
ncbi:peroxisomal sarcosine oxidase-like isoform X2 [Amphiura filiformis]